MRHAHRQLILSSSFMLRTESNPSSKSGALYRSAEDQNQVRQRHILFFSPSTCTDHIHEFYFNVCSLPSYPIHVT